jgi:hypothetical protein
VNKKHSAASAQSGQKRKDSGMATVLETTPEHLRAGTRTWDDAEIAGYGECMALAAEATATSFPEQAAHYELLAQTCEQIVQERRAAQIESGATVLVVSGPNDPDYAHFIGQTGAVTSVSGSGLCIVELPNGDAAAFTGGELEIQA